MLLDVTIYEINMPIFKVVSALCVYHLCYAVKFLYVQMMCVFISVHTVYVSRLLYIGC